MRSSRTHEPFVQAVRRLADERGLTLRRLAADAGMSHGYLVRVLQGNKPLSRNLLRNVTSALDLPEDYFREARIDKIVEAVESDDLLAEDVYEQVVPAETMDASKGMMSLPATAGMDSKARMVKLTALLLQGASGPHLVRLGAAALLRYRTDDEFRLAVDAALPDIERLAKELNTAG